MDNEDLGDLPITSLPPPSSDLSPSPHKISRNNRKNNIFLLLNNRLLLQISLTSQPPRENPEVFFKKVVISMKSVTRTSVCYFEIDVI